MSDELKALIERSRALVAAMTPEEFEAMLREQAKSYARAEMAFGSDADERAWREANMEDKE